MNETQRLALTAAFLTAVVVAGLSLSLVPHVELVTLTVFCSGILLGPRRGGLVGAVGMPLYVFANSAVRGFPPSPLPVLAAQALGMALAGLAGGWWRSFWSARWGTPRVAWLLLPFLGFLLAAGNQSLLNLSYAYFLSSDETSRLVVFLSGMSFGLVDMVWNAVVFGFAGPPAASILRRTARSRGWWGSVAAIGAVALGLPGITFAEMQDPDSLATATPPDSMTIITVPSALPAPADTAAMKIPKPRRVPRREMDLVPMPLYREVDATPASQFGVAGWLDAGLLDGGEVSRRTTPGLPASVDRWALGWGRTRFLYDGLPLRGPVHGLDNPPDLPLAWRGTWSEKRTASGSTVHLGLPDTLQGAPQSQVSLTTGSLGRRSAEFALFRNLGPVGLGVDFGDREEQGWISIDQSESSRLWVHLGPSTPRWPRWTLDLSSAVESRKLFTGEEIGRDVRRVQGSVRVPLWEGEGRLGVQWRRQALQSEGSFDSFGETLFDGFTVQTDWGGSDFFPVAGWLRWEREGRRGVLAKDVSFAGIVGGIRTTGNLGRWGTWGADLETGWREPYGFTWGGSTVLDVQGRGWRLGGSISHEEDLPAKVLGVDRPTPGEALAGHLDEYETTTDPEQRSAVRVEGEVQGGRLRVQAGGWMARQRNYRIDANPVWTAFELYSPLDDIPYEADILGVHGGLGLDLGKGFSGEGKGRVHDRDLVEVPYLSQWLLEGTLRWRRWWFQKTLDLDISLGGYVIGPRRNPDGERYLTTAFGYLTLEGWVGNGKLTVSFQNLVDGFLESDLRSSDTVTPLPVPGRILLVGLTMYLTR